MKYFLVILAAMFIDGLQAGISFALAGLFASPGVVPIIGTAIAAVSVPFGIVLGFLINICLSLTMGSGLVLALVFVCGKDSVMRFLMPGFLGDTIPGINNLPFWTFLAVASSWVHATQTGKLGVVGSIANIVVAPTRGIMNIKEQTMNIAQRAAGISPQEQNRIVPALASEALQNKSAQARVPMQDIRLRAANDNVPQKTYAAAA